MSIHNDDIQSLCSMYLVLHGYDILTLVVSTKRTFKIGFGIVPGTPYQVPGTSEVHTYPGSA